MAEAGVPPGPVVPALDKAEDGHSGLCLRAEPAPCQQLVAYSWQPSPDPRSEGDTVITADWSLDVLPDGSLRPFKPDAIELRDGELVRPVCPFIEIWARLGEDGSDASTWRDVPLTETLLGSFNANRAAITFTIDARNSKAARRAQDNN